MGREKKKNLSEENGEIKKIEKIILKEGRWIGIIRLKIKKNWLVDLLLEKNFLLIKMKKGKMVKNIKLDILERMKFEKGKMGRRWFMRVKGLIWWLRDRVER